MTSGPTPPRGDFPQGPSAARQKKKVLVQRSDIRKTRKGENFATLGVNLGREGDFAQVNAKIWQSDRFTGSGRALPSAGQAIEVGYREEEYEGARQWVIEDFRPLEGRELEETLRLFVQPTRINGPFYRKRLDELIAQADPDHVCGQILREVFDSISFREAFLHAPAAKSRHQNYPGGLLEHTLNVTSVALALASAYDPGAGLGLTINSESLPVDRTLLIAAGLLHDIGKLQTYRLAPLSEATDANSFEGHLSISYAIVRAISQPLREAPPYAGAVDQIDKLLNCILSHHGTLQFGSPVLPACVEAFLLSTADLTDARVADIVTEGRGVRRRDPNARWIKLAEFTGGMFVGDWPDEPA